MLKSLANMDNLDLISDLNTLNNLLNLSDPKRVKQNFTLIKSFNDIKKMTENKIKKHRHLLPYKYNYLTLLEKPKIDLTTGLRLYNWYITLIEKFEYAEES